MTDKGYIEWTCILLAGAASAIAVYEFMAHHGPAKRGAASPSAPVNQSTAAPQNSFMGGLFGVLPSTGQGADYVSLSPPVVFS